MPSHSNSAPTVLPVVESNAKPEDARPYPDRAARLAASAAAKKLRFFLGENECLLSLPTGGVDEQRGLNPFARGSQIEKLREQGGTCFRRESSPQVQNTSHTHTHTHRQTDRRTDRQTRDS